MGCDAVVALGRAAVGRHTLFGHNSSPARAGFQPLCRTSARTFAVGEKVRTSLLEVPQARQVHAVLGSRPAGAWGYDHGVNEHQVGAGRVPLPTTLPAEEPGLTGTDLVRLVLERSRSARQAVDQLTVLVERYGQASDRGDSTESAFLIADPSEAYAIETAGRHWVYQQVREVRAASGARVVHQDWNRISCGLAEHAIAQAWWPGDGSKLDFAAAVEHLGPDPDSLRRWGHASIRLQEQNGHIDTDYLRRLLAEHAADGGLVDEAASLCRHGSATGGPTTVASLVAELSADPDRLCVAWCAFGPPCAAVYFPLFPDVELPEPFTQGSPLPGGFGPGWRMDRQHEPLLWHTERWSGVSERFGRLQQYLDEEAEEFLAEASGLKARGLLGELKHRAGAFMEHALDRFEGLAREAEREEALVGAGR
jgi:hypothetical protein